MYYTVDLINNKTGKRFQKLFTSYYIMQNFIRKVKYGKALTYLGHTNPFWHDN